MSWWTDRARRCFSMNRCPGGKGRLTCGPPTKTLAWRSSTSTLIHDDGDLHEIDQDDYESRQERAFSGDQERIVSAGSRTRPFARRGQRPPYSEARLSVRRPFR